MSELYFGAGIYQHQYNTSSWSKIQEWEKDRNFFFLFFFYTNMCIKQHTAKADTIKKGNKKASLNKYSFFKKKNFT